MRYFLWIASSSWEYKSVH